MSPFTSRTAGALRAQAQAGSALAAALGLPGAGLLRGRRSPVVSDATLAGRPATVVRPDSGPPWPTAVFANGATPDGRAHPAVRRLALALARSGYAIHIPDLPGISAGELTPATLAAAKACVTEVVESPEACHGRAGLVGVSVGGTLALLVAADAGLASRISVVACIAPFSSLKKVMQLATTGMYRTGRGVAPYPVPPSLALGLARSIAALLEDTPAARRLYDELRALDDDSSDPLAPLRDRADRPLGADEAAVRELLANRDPERFDQLFDALPAGVREAVDVLSPVCSASQLLAPVEIATAPRDKYFPAAESRALAAASPRVRVTVTSTLAHAVPRLDRRSLAGLVRLDRFFVRSLVALR